MIKEKLTKELERIFNLDTNKLNYSEFKSILHNLYAKDCQVKTGWVSGEYISFACNFIKEGNSNPIDLIVDGIENISEVYYFICGLNPEVFHFNKKMILDEPDNFF